MLASGNDAAAARGVLQPVAAAIDEGHELGGYRDVTSVLTCLEAD